MSRATIKAEIDANIKQNGNQEITGLILNSVLNQINDGHTTKVRVDITGTTGSYQFKIGNQVLNFQDLNNLLQVSPDFLVFVHGKREHRCTFIDLDSNPKQMRFVAPLLNDGTLKTQSFYVTSNDGVAITSIVSSNINCENSSNKRSDLSNPNNTNYPTTKAVNDALAVRDTKLSELEGRLNKSVDISSSCPYTPAIAAIGTVGSVYTTTVRNPNQGMTRIEKTGNKITISGLFYSISRHLEYIDDDGIIISTKQYPQNVEGTYELEFPESASAVLVNSQGQLTIVEQVDVIENLDSRLTENEEKISDLNSARNVWVELPIQTKRGRIAGAVGALVSVDANTGYYHFFIKNDGGKYKALVVPPNNMRSLTYVDASGKVLGFNSNITDNQYHELEIDWSLYDDIDGVYVCGLAITSITKETFFVKLYQYKEVKVLANENYESLSKRIKSPVELWYGKTLACYGDSVTELNQDTHYEPDVWKLGDYKKPYDFLDSASKYSWAKRVATYVGFDKLMIRGVGSQGYEWQVAGNNGGQIVFCYKDTGRYIGRMDGDLSTWDGSDLTNYNSTWYGNTKDIISAGLADGTIVATRGAGCSWSRIKTMFPESIKDTIDVVLVMYHNDAGQDSTTEATFVQNDTTDAEWATSGAEYYGVYGGDYNIKTIKGAIASMIMKMQLWMPNAVIVLMTPISGVYNASNVVGTNFNYGGMNLLADAVRDMHEKLSIPMIDIYATCGINVLNRNKFISDTIHPRKEAGSKMIARAVIGGLNSILPLDAVEYDEKNEL